jgi:hypothetical protein
MELQQANRELVKEKEILRSHVDSLPNKATHSTMTSPGLTSPYADPASAVSLNVITNVYILRLSLE